MQNAKHIYVNQNLLPFTCQTWVSTGIALCWSREKRATQAATFGPTPGNVQRAWITSESSTSRREASQCAPPPGFACNAFTAPTMYFALKFFNDQNPENWKKASNFPTQLSKRKKMKKKMMMESCITCIRSQLAEAAARRPIPVYLEKGTRRNQNPQQSRGNARERRGRRPSWWCGQYCCWKSRGTGKGTPRGPAAARGRRRGKARGPRSEGRRRRRSPRGGQGRRRGWGTGEGGAGRGGGRWHRWCCGRGRRRRRRKGGGGGRRGKGRRGRWSGRRRCRARWRSGRWGRWGGGWARSGRFGGAPMRRLGMGRVVWRGRGAFAIGMVGAWRGRAWGRKGSSRPPSPPLSAASSAPPASETGWAPPLPPRHRPWWSLKPGKGYQIGDLWHRGLLTF